jgi:hypothetical protein
LPDIRPYRLGWDPQFVESAFAVLYERDILTARRLKDEYREVLAVMQFREIYRDRAHSLPEMLNWLGEDLTLALNAVCKDEETWRYNGETVVFSSPG